MEISYIMAFTTGFIGGFGHCIGMCGPIIAAYSVAPLSYGNNKRNFSFKQILPHFFYNTGRISTYMFIGGFMGLAGSFANTAGKIAGFQDVVSVFAGVLMMIMGLGILGVWRGVSVLEKHNSLILRFIKMFVFERSVWRYYPMGALLGFLPCGLSYSIFAASAGTGSFLSGMLISLVFGLGTLPALISFGTLITYMSGKVRGIIYRISGIAVIIMGLYFIWRAVRSNV
jgi:sulfite exporter TauE/SafE